MWSIFVEFRSATLEIRRRKEKKERKKKKHWQNKVRRHSMSGGLMNEDSSVQHYLITIVVVSHRDVGGMHFFSFLTQEEDALANQRFVATVIQEHLHDFLALRGRRKCTTMLWHTECNSLLHHLLSCRTSSPVVLNYRPKQDLEDKITKSQKVKYNKITFKRIRSLSNAVCFKHDNNVCLCVVSALILLPVCY